MQFCKTNLVLLYYIKFYYQQLNTHLVRKRIFCIHVELKLKNKIQNNI